MNERGKVEIRGPAEGGVREVQALPELPVEVKKVNEETGELEDYAVTKKVSWLDKVAEWAQEIKDRNAACNPKDSAETTLSPPTEHNTTETQPE